MYRRVLVSALAGMFVVIAGAASAQSPAPARAGAQTPAPPAGTAMISGVVQAADNGRPARRARVSLVGGDPRIAQTIVTSDTGEFNFTGLPGGDFTLSVTKAGWLDSTFGQKHPGSGRAGTPIALAAGQRIEHLALPFARGGVLTGTVIDEQGEASFGTQIRAMRYVMKSGDRQLVAAGSTTTDDRGVYRIPGLLPGDYVIAAVPRDADGPGAEEKASMEQVATAKMAASTASGADMAQAMQDIQKLLESMAGASDPAKAPTSGYAPVYYPNTTTGATATVISLGISEEKPGLDVQLQIVPLTRVAGVVTTADGPVPSGAQVLLLDNGQGLPGALPRSARVGSDGRFSFTSVQQGEYTLFARATLPSANLQQVREPAMAMSMQGMPMSAQAGKELEVLKAAAAGGTQLWALADVNADARNITPVTLMLQPGMTISGALTFDGGTVPADLSRVRLALTPFGQGAASETASSIRPVALDADRKFTLAGVVPGQYRISLASSAGLSGWSMKSATVAGQDMLDMPLEVKPNQSVNGLTVTMSMRATDLRGTLQGPSGQPAADYTVVVFAAGDRYWVPQSRRVQATRPSTEGRFAFQGLPPGEYRIAAVTDVEPGAWFAPDFLRQLVGASTPITLGEGERKTQDVKIAR